MIVCNGLIFEIQNSNDLIVKKQNDVQHPIVYRENLGKCPATKQKTLVRVIEGNTYQIETSCGNLEWDVEEVDEIRK